MYHNLKAQVGFELPNREANNIIITESIQL